MLAHSSVHTQFSFCFKILTKDSVTVSVDAVCYFRIYDPVLSVNSVENAHRSTQLLAQTTLRNHLGLRTLAEILSERDEIAHNLQSNLDEATDPWGVKVIIKEDNSNLFCCWKFKILGIPATSIVRKLSSIFSKSGRLIFIFCLLNLLPVNVQLPGAWLVLINFDLLITNLSIRRLSFYIGWCVAGREGWVEGCPPPSTIAESYGCRSWGC